MSGGRQILGVDYGSKRIGLAVSVAEGKIALPLMTHERGSKALEAAFFCGVVDAEEIDLIVVGLPVHLDGREGQKAAEVRVFGTWLAETTGLPVIYFDERFTTVEAESALWEAGLSHRQRKDRRDRVAAQILLQTYLDAGCPDNPEAGPLEEPEKNP